MLNPVKIFQTKAYVDSLIYNKKDKSSASVL